jgi:RNA polymerase sigma-70 factor (ECF subfamily)
MQQGVTEEQICGIYRDTIDALYGFVSRRCGGNRARAEDITQDTWLRAVRAWRQQGVPARPLAWLTTVARNLLFNEFRRLAPLPLDEVTSRDILAAADNLPVSDSAEIAAVVNHALGRLPGRQQRMLEAFHYDRCSVAQIAELFAISERAVEGRLRRARQNLRKELEAALEAAGGIQ